MKHREEEQRDRDGGEREGNIGVIFITLLICLYTQSLRHESTRASTSIAVSWVDVQFWMYTQYDEWKYEWVDDVKKHMKN